jgi:hypothetical protein
LASATVTLGNSGFLSWLSNWHTMSIQIAPTTDIFHPPAGGLWARVSFDGAVIIDQLADAAPALGGGCVGIGAFGTRAAFDDIIVTAP